ncbi:uncharacterized protein METZ01_LOCUS443139, partial [marine metagenome]
MAFATILPDPTNKRGSWGANDASGDAGPGFASVKLTSDQKMLMSRTNSQRVIARSVAGHKWNIDIGYHPMTREEFEPVYTFLLQQRGSLTPFFAALPQYSEPRNSAFSLEGLVNSLTTVGIQSAGTTSLKIGHGSYGPSPNDATATNIPAPGDIFTISDDTNTNHTKVYMVTYVETYHVYGGSGVRPAAATNLNIGINSPLIKEVPTGKPLVFKATKFKVILPKAIQQ